jgi:hypothetical protein
VRSMRRPAPPRAGDKAEIALHELGEGGRPRPRVSGWVAARVVSVDGGRILFQPVNGKLIAYTMPQEGKAWRRGWALDRKRAR